MWPPIEMYETAKLNARLKMTMKSAEPPKTLMWLRSRTSPAPRIPKTAPDAPMVAAVGERMSAPAEPARSEMK